MQLPIGAEDSFKGVVDLIKMKAIYWDEANQGMTFEEREIPADMQDSVKSGGRILVEAAAEANEELMEKYLRREYLTDEEIKNGITCAND